MAHQPTIGRRKLLKALGAGSVVSVAGCAGGGGGNGGGGDGGFAAAAEELGLQENWQARRIDNASNWAMEDREGVPEEGATTWTDSTAFQSALDANMWQPPEGWDDTAAGDIDELVILNHGAANMEFDPATKAAHEMFTELTGIPINPIEIGVDQALQREQQALSSGQQEPHAMNVDGSLVPGFVGQGWLEITDVLYPDGAYDPYIPALEALVSWDIDSSREGTHTYGYPNIVEGSLGHLRVDLVEEQGLDPGRFQGEWSWDDLEALMEAFAGTDVHGYAYYAGTSTYLGYSFRELLYQQGGRMVQDDGSVKMDTDEAITVVEKMKEWRDKGWVPGDVISYGEGDIVDLYQSGQLAFATGFSDFVPTAMNAFEPGEQYLPVLPPMANTGTSPTQAGVVDPNSTSINTHSSEGHKLASLLYGDLKLSYAIQWWEFTYEGNMSYMSQVYQDAAEAGFSEYGDVLGQSIDNTPLELFPGMNDVLQQMANPVQRAIQGNIAPADAMAEVQSYVDENINQ